MKITMEHISKQFGQTLVLRELDLSLPEGEFVSLLGPSGCGKTTLLRILAGFEVPTQGRVLFDQDEVSRPGWGLPPEKRNIAMVFQSFALWPHMTVREHLQFPLRHHRFATDQIKKNADSHIEQTLQVVGLDHLADRYPGQLSGGQRQRVSLARAMVVRPAILLMDEPLSALDAGLRLAMREELQRIHRICGCTILYVTHDQNEALAMSDRVLIMHEGVIEQNGTPAEIYNQPATPFVAQFVSGSNLLQGHWVGDTFHFGNQQSYKWTVPDVLEGIKREGLCPLRPDQLDITNNASALPGIISNIQFQGKENFYTIETILGNLQLHAPSRQSYLVGQQVYVQPRQVS